MKYKPLCSFLFCALLLNTVANAQMKISNGAAVVVGSGANINLANISLDYGNGTLSGDGKFIFSGSADNTISGNTTIKHIYLAKSTGSKLALANNLLLSGSFDFGSGILDLNGYNLNLGNTGTLLNENNNSFATGNSGYVVREASLNAPAAVNAGNLGVAITTASNLGNTIIRRGNYAISDGNNQSIKRFFEIEPTNNTNLNATLRFLYLDGELNSLQENQLRFMQSEDNGATWSGLTSTINAAQNYVEVSGVNSFGRMSLVNDFTLPLSLLKLSGKIQKVGVTLNWLTLNEVDVSHFLTEKSYDGKRFVSFSEVRSKSETSKDNNYTVNDINPLLGINYYRITAVDKDGKTNFSNIIPINFSLTKEEQANIYPNPAAKNINGTFYLPLAQQVKLAVISSIGKVELNKSVNAVPGLNHFSFDVSALPIGVYFIQIVTANSNQQLKFIKN
mgnify:CR=1 FL=1